MDKGPGEEKQGCGRKQKRRNKTHLLYSDILGKYSLFKTLRGCSDQTY